MMVFLVEFSARLRTSAFGKLRHLQGESMCYYRSKSIPVRFPRQLELADNAYPIQKRNARILRGAWD